jgi:hypothetical protein
VAGEDAAEEAVRNAAINVVMAELVPAIHVLPCTPRRKTWVLATSASMTHEQMGRLYFWHTGQKNVDRPTCTIRFTVPLQPGVTHFSPSRS